MTFQASFAGNGPPATGYFYSNRGRLAKVVSGGTSVQYTYTPGSDRVQRRDSFPATSTQRLLAANHSYNSTGSLVSVVNTRDALDTSNYNYWVYNTQPYVSTVYTVDNLDRRKRASREDGTAWHYDYNSRSEVVGAWKSRDGANAVRLPGMDRAYDYDNIGNRISAKEGGNGSGLARRTYAYATNELNLYTSVTRGAESGGKTRGVDFTGTAGSESMTVNGVVAQRSGPWWRAEVEPATAADLFVAGDVKANGTSLAAEPRKVPSPPTTLSLTAPAPNPIQYDLDGNLLCDGWRRYTWDGEQRLVKVETLFPAPHKTTTTFAYDAFGRRIAKTVTQKEWQASVEVDVIKEDLRFLYHGWNLAAVYSVATTWNGSTWVTDTTLTQSFVWGIDIGSDGLDATPAGHLASPFSRAGGVGGLILARFHQEPTAEREHFPCYDGNGNVLALIAAKHEGGTTAAYDYDPFGNTVSATGPLAEKNPFRFSTKYTDVETGLVYYGYRYLDTSWGRWINRDPMEEDGGLNLVGFVGNKSVGRVDFLGLFYAGTPYDSSRWGAGGDLVDRAKWLIGKHLMGEIYGALPVAAMNHADGTLPGDWNLSEDEASWSKKGLETDAFQLSTRKSFDQFLKDYIYNKFIKKVAPSPALAHGTFKTDQEQFHFEQENKVVSILWAPTSVGNHPNMVPVQDVGKNAGPEVNYYVKRYVKGAGYYTFGDARIEVEGTVCVSDNILWHTVEVKAKVQLRDNFTFAPYARFADSALMPTAVGFRLQDAGYLKRFNAAGSWKYDVTYRYGADLSDD